MKTFDHPICLRMISRCMISLIRRRASISLHNDDVNCGPRSDEITPGTSKRAIQPVMRACTHSGVVMPFRGIASDQRVFRSIIVRRYVKPGEKRKDPTMSMFMYENLFSGTKKMFQWSFCVFFYF